MARDRQESDSGGLGSPGIFQEVSRLAGGARSQMNVSLGHLEADNGTRGRQE